MYQLNVNSRKEIIDQEYDTDALVEDFDFDRQNQEVKLLTAEEKTDEEKKTEEETNEEKKTEENTVEEKTNEEKANEQKTNEENAVEENTVEENQGIRFLTDEENQARALFCEEIRGVCSVVVVACTLLQIMFAVA